MVLALPSDWNDRQTVDPSRGDPGSFDSSPASSGSGFVDRLEGDGISEPFPLSRPEPAPEEGCDSCGPAPSPREPAQGAPGAPGAPGAAGSDGSDAVSAVDGARASTVAVREEVRRPPWPLLVLIALATGWVLQ